MKFYYLVWIECQSADKESSPFNAVLVRANCLPTPSFHPLSRSHPDPFAFNTTRTTWESVGWCKIIIMQFRRSLFTYRKPERCVRGGTEEEESQGLSMLVAAEEAEDIVLKGFHWHHEGWVAEWVGALLSLWVTIDSLRKHKYSSQMPPPHCTRTRVCTQSRPARSAAAPFVATTSTYIVIKELQPRS